MSKRPVASNGQAAPVSTSIRVRGQVQGVGFRPFVYRVAKELGIAGWVRNDGEGVEIAAQGEKTAISKLLLRLKSDAPPLARITSVETKENASLPPLQGFSIQESQGGPAHTAIAPDTTTCPACLAELFDQADRRYRYPFINCTDCGPRYTITRHLPYDRPHTSMASFPLCPVCSQEYRNPDTRRFHAEPNACPVCGPRLSLRNAAGQFIETPDVIATTVALLKSGEILAIKGLGGFHLVCDARNTASVAALRERKQREEKPFAIMAANPVSLKSMVITDTEEAALLQARERPIVLLRKQPGCDAALPGIAPGIAWLGAMLPYTPLHHLLFHEAAGRPSGTVWLEQPQDLLLMMTSANPCGEPLVIGNDEAQARLGGIADAFVLHDRDIVVRCDDSVVRAGRERGMGNEEWVKTAAPSPSPITHHSLPAFIRRARGYTPRAILLPRSGPSVLACGGCFKNTICLTRGNEAFVSQHLGDLDNAPTCEALEETIAHLVDVLEIQPEIVAHDLHPDFHSTRFALEFAREHGIPALAVQHHHAHIAAVLSEQGIDEPALGLALDGVGLGKDGSAWGGELLRLENGRCERLGHLAHLQLPGGDRAAREPWRMAASALHALGRDGEITQRYYYPAAPTLRQMLQQGVNTPSTSSCGRLFDAAAGLLRVKDMTSFEGQAAMLLEGLAEKHGKVAHLPDGYTLNTDGTLNFLPLLSALTDTPDPAYGAALFHATLAQGLTKWVMQAAQQSGIKIVALGGGCFLNAILSRNLFNMLTEVGLTVLEARQVPPNDGGLSLGQAWVAINRGLE
ncbi:MAG: carbamoyltransferase HypF [Gammaproteobacteria bacterium]|nr:carbamoyltransferase HypF [Gammaproteobacteria bacterium]MBU1732053.1 carbamoyltransferase HypF [Gammaproteobacteria bacterium]MBU1894094.1 carbamoyltransferase HypF [Gammaproteobacteria bacterium]